MAVTHRITAEGWEVAEHGPAGARHAVLMLPAALASAAFYDDVAAEPALAGVRLVATTLPGYAGTVPVDDLSVEGAAGQAARLARDVGAEVVVGHSLGANIAIEMVASGEFEGPVVLLAPSFSRRDESRAPRTLDWLAEVFGPMPYAVAFRMASVILRGQVPPARLEPLAAELRRNDPRVVRRATRLYFRHLDRHGSLAPRLCASGVRAWVVYGAKDDIGLTPAERHALEECPRVTLVTIPDTGHFTLNTHPDRIADLIVEALEGVTRRWPLGGAGRGP